MITKEETKQTIEAGLEKYGFKLWNRQSNEGYYRLENDKSLAELARTLAEAQYYLVTVVANDERELEDHSFKIYYLFSHPANNQFLILEVPVEDKASGYCSIRASFPVVKPFELEIADLFGLYPDRWSSKEKPYPQALIRDDYLKLIYPLRRDAVIPPPISTTQDTKSRPPKDQKLQKAPGPGEVVLPVGPIHGGTIEPGRFLFHTSGETIERLDIRLGYTHKGIEWLYQNNYKLSDGWKLAEHVSGDSSFAHSMAYSKAVEILVNCSVPPKAKLLRGVFLEMERLVNHVGDTGVLAQNVSLDVIASEIAVLREELLALNEKLCGSRFLRGLNRPGGLNFEKLNLNALEGSLEEVCRITQRYLQRGKLLLTRDDFRHRALGVGVLSQEQARILGAVGLVARASGLKRDFRLQHSFWPYSDAYVQKLVEASFSPPELLVEKVEKPELAALLDSREKSLHELGYTDYFKDYGIINWRGDVYSRLIQRLQEVQSSCALLKYFYQMMQPLTPEKQDYYVEPKLGQANNFDFGFGYVEGWRGEIIYWIMKDKFNGIYRCKVRDPSTLNWPVLKEAIAPELTANGQETALADFPLINKSFNLSYSGNDL